MTTVTNQDIAESLRYTNTMLEQVLGQNQTVLEIVGAMQEDVAKIPQMQRDISELRSDVATIKYAVTETNIDLHKLEARVTRLELAGKP